mgnify:CR=1 FL=1
MRLIEQVWFQSNRAKWLVVPVLFPLSLLFMALTGLRRALYKTAAFKSYQVTKPVVVVGNIGIGGNGKTPVVLYLVEQCIKLGIKPGVLSRGYGGEAPHYPYLLDDSSTAMAAGDEPILIYKRSGVPVVVGSDRVASAKLLIEQGCDVLIADDGLQHYRLARDLELLVVDGNRLFGNGLLLPAGPLREGQWRLASVDAVIVNGGDNQTKPLSDNSMTLALEAEQVCHLLTGEQQSIGDFLKQYPEVNALAGIGDPSRFFNTLTREKFQLNQQQAFVDHHNFTEHDFIDFDETLPLLMTEKDAVKCRAFAQQHWWYVPVNSKIPAEHQANLLAKINSLTV